MKRERTVAELRYSVVKSRRSNRIMFWMCGIQCALGAVWILLSDGGWGWGWCILGFILMLVYRGLMIVNDITLKKLEGLPDDL